MDKSAWPAALERLDLTSRLLGLIAEDDVVVAGLGNTSFDLFAAGHRPGNFYMLGSMGLAIPIGLGLALSQPDREVVVLDGDGSILMDVGSLSTVGMVNPPNLTIICWDNGAYQTTGGQATASAVATDLVTLARGAGIERAAWAARENEFDELVGSALRSTGPAFIAVRVTRAASRTHPEFDPVFLKLRFHQELGLRPGIEREAALARQ